MAKMQKKQKSQSDDFVGDDVVSGGKAPYMKFETGANKFRALSKPISGWVVWEEDEDGNRKPVRTSIIDEPEAPDDDPRNAPKKFLALVVLDRADDEVKILEITQQSVIKAVKAYAANPDWGNPFSYDLTVTKKGEGKKTRYTVVTSPKKPLEKNLVKEAMAKPCNLDAMYEGENPWAEDQDNYTEYCFK